MTNIYRWLKILLSVSVAAVSFNLPMSEQRRETYLHIYFTSTSVEFIFLWCHFSINPLEKIFLKGSVGYLSVCLFICMFVLSIVATPFNPQLCSFGITFLMWMILDIFFQIFEKLFFPELLPIFYISLRFICTFEEQLRKHQRR